VIDPLTRDLIDAADGGFLESTDSRTAVLFQLESHYRGVVGRPVRGQPHPRDPRERRRSRSADDLRDETLRALQPLVDDGIISDLAVELDTDENGRTVVLLLHRSGERRPVDLAYVPFGG
jgi:hypothetical protein